MADLKDEKRIRDFPHDFDDHLTSCPQLLCPCLMSDRKKEILLLF